MPIVLAVGGFFLLIKGADFLVEGASSLALKLSVSEIVIGLTVVAFGTSTPELVVNLFSSVEGRPEMALGNVVGSCIVNILLILGVAAIIRPLGTEKNTVWREIPFSLLAAVALFVLCNDALFGDSGPSSLSRTDGVVLLLFFSIFLSYVFAIPKVQIQDQFRVKQLSSGKMSVFIAAGLVAQFLGGKLVVDNVVTLASQLGMSEKLVALTVVSLGTSLPELSTSAVAAYRGNQDIAVGNIVGSNIFNIFLIMGLSASIAPVSFNPAFNFDLAVLIVSSALLFVTMFTGKRRFLDRWEAILFVVFYAGYVAMLALRG